MAGVYIVAQLIGAIARRVRAQGAASRAMFAATRGGGQSIALDITAAQAFVLEAIATFFLMFVDLRHGGGPARRRKIGGFAIGLTSPRTFSRSARSPGGSMNPARSFGPAVASGIFEGQ